MKLKIQNVSIYIISVIPLVDILMTHEGDPQVGAAGGRRHDRSLVVERGKITSASRLEIWAREALGQNDLL